MSTTCQQVVARAIGRNIANRLTSLTADSAEMIHRIDLDARQLRAGVTEKNRTFFQDVVARNSTSGASPRVVDLSEVRVLRVLKVSLQDAPLTEISIVDFRDPDAELAPRCYPRGKQLVEIGTDWGNGTAEVPVYVWYLQSVARLDRAAGLGQEVSVEDDYAWLLDNRLAAYLSSKDTGRDPQEIKDLDAEYDSGVEDFIDYANGIAGTMVDRFFLPPPQPKP
jgi:hypothetical protein